MLLEWLKLKQLIKELKDIKYEGPIGNNLPEGYQYCRITYKCMKNIIKLSNCYFISNISRENRNSREENFLLSFINKSVY